MRIFILSVGIMTSSSVFSIELSNTEFQQTEDARHSIETNTLSATELAQARIWDLSEVEWQRYKSLMQGIRGSVSPETISPIEVLGIHARNDVERQRYAEIWAQDMREDVTRILAFQHAYDAAQKHLYPNEPLIDTSLLPVKETKSDIFQLTDRVLFFTSPDCPVCDMLLTRLFKRINQISGIDIYLVGIEKGNDLAVRDWASNHQIKPDWVRTRRITLNHDAGALDRLTNGQAKAPYLLRRRAGELSPISASDI